VDNSILRHPGARLSKNCSRCNQSFFVYPCRAKQRFCSVRCADENKRVVRIAKCQECDAPFAPKRPSDRYCSKRCRGNARKHRVLRTCKRCGSSFSVPASRSSQQYCSHSCADTSRAMPLCGVSFWDNVNKAGKTISPSLGPCWEWTSRRDRFGYGYMQRARKYWLAHRASWVLANGDPGALHVLHKCDNPACVRPDHLFLGTAGDNILDCLLKGRNRPSHGAKNARAKLNATQVKEILSSNLPAKELARAFSVSPLTIWRLRSGIGYAPERAQALSARTS
jgi:hypothetical protein